MLAYDVLVRIAEGLGIPRELMGLSYSTYGGDVTRLRVGKPEVAGTALIP